MDNDLAISYIRIREGGKGAVGRSLHSVYDGALLLVLADKSISSPVRVAGYEFRLCCFEDV